jgi:hypothetical protein
VIHLLESGHSNSLLFLGQLHMSRLFVVEVVDSVDLLCPSIVCLMFVIKKLRLANISRNILTIWWIIPYNFSFTASGFVVSR